MPFTYPSIRRDESIAEKHFGIEIADPYRWLEDPDSEETQAFTAAQNKVTQSYFKKCTVTEEIREKLREIWNYERYSCPFSYGSYYYYWKNDGLQNQSVLYQLASIKDPEDSAKVFLDPNALDEAGLASVRTYAFSEAGQTLCYGLSFAGSDWCELKFKDCKGKDLPDHLKRVKFTSLAWTHDEAGIFYSMYQQNGGKSDGTETTSNKDQKLMYHRLGTSQDEDILCVERPDEPEWGFGAEVSDCGQYLFISFRHGCEPSNQLFYYHLTQGIHANLKLTPIVDKFEAEFDYITNEASVVTLRTNLEAPMYKLITIDLENLSRANWKDLIPHDPKSLLEAVMCVDTDKLVVNKLVDVKAHLSIHNLVSGARIKDIDLPLGSIEQISGRKSQKMAFFSYASFLTPGKIYHYDFSQANPALELYREVKLGTVAASVLDRFTTKQVFYPSKDGTKIPMFLVIPKDIPMDGSTPCRLYGYGGFDISLTPSFSLVGLFFALHFGGMYAVANLRGGGEYGKTWHDSGRLHKKQNVFNDFQAAAEFLVQEKFTRKEKLFIEGGSNGGLLVCACINQRPDLFGAAVTKVPVCDMLRFHKFTIGHAWTSDFGDPDKEEDFKFLLTYSPLHNVSKATDSALQCPALLLQTADHDDRVVPLHSFKYIAALQHERAHLPCQTNPMLASIESNAGHGAGKPTTKKIDEVTDTFAFLQVALDLKWSSSQ